MLTFASTPDHLPATPTPELVGLQSFRDGPEGIYAVYPADMPAQLLFLPGSDRRALVALVPIDIDLLDRVDALTRFWRTLYGRMNGASYREIASAIYGEARVTADPWKTSPLRDSVIGLIESGLVMVGGGYLNLLRHRRRP